MFLEFIEFLVFLGLTQETRKLKNLGSISNLNFFLSCQGRDYGKCRRTKNCVRNGIDFVKKTERCY